MAYAQKHMAKSPLKQIGGKIQAAKEYVAKKEKEGMDYKETKQAQRFANREKGTGVLSGTEINVKTKQVEAKPFEKKFVESKGGAPAMITDASGKPIKKAAYSSVNSKAIDALRKEYNKMKGFTEESRAANAIVQSGKAKRGGGFK